MPKVSKWHIEIIVTDKAEGTEPAFTPEELTDAIMHDAPAGIELQVIKCAPALHAVQAPTDGGVVTIWSSQRSGIDLPPRTMIVSDDLLEAMKQDPTITLTPGGVTLN